MTNIETIKELLSEHRFRIKLYDHVLAQVSAAASAMSESSFPTTGPRSQDEFVTRLHQYEAEIRDLLHTQALISFWGETYQNQVLILPPKRVTAQFVSQSGLSGWLELRWYPVSLLLYTGGIAAVAARRYENLKELLLLPIEDRERRRRQPLVMAAAAPIDNLNAAFKAMPGHDRFFAPQSEYLHAFLQPMLDSALSVGSEYEACFDEFEILYVLECAYQRSLHEGSLWGSPGRFGWKYERGEYGSPYHLLMSQATQAGNRWAPVEVGLFGGSIDHFLKVAKQYSEYLSRLHWR